MKKKVSVKQQIKPKKIMPTLFGGFNLKAAFVVFFMAFALYANTFYHEYALDDLIVLTENKYVTQGIGGFKEIVSQDLFAGYYGQQALVEGSRYRPLSLLTFAVEWEFFGQRPHVSHAINVFLYAVSCLMVYLVLTMLFRVLDKDREWYFSFAFIGTVLFVAHPIHTEVVANIKGRDEILSLLFSFTTLFFWIQYHEYSKIRDLLLGILAFFFALLSKENAFTFLAVIPLCLYFFTPVNLKKNLTSIVWLFIPAIIYLLIRHTVTMHVTGIAVKDLMNDSFIGMTFAERYATIFYTLGYYIKLLIFPHPLTYDYYPYHIPIMNWSSMLVLISFLGYIALGVFAVMTISKRNIFSFIIFFYLFTLSISSNVFFSIGAFMNERFIFISSLAFTIGFAWLILYGSNYFKMKWPFMVCLVIILGLYAFKTIDRNADWKNDNTLTMQDVKTSSNSAKSNASAGFLYMTEAEQTKDSLKRSELFEKAIFHFEQALKIHPTFSNTMINLGSAYYKYKFDYRTTIEYYLKSLSINPNFNNVYESIFKLLAFEQNTPASIDYKINVLTRLWTLYPEKYDVNAELSNMYKMKNDIKSASYYADRAQQIQRVGQSNSLY